MNKTIFLNENYGKKLRDEIISDPSKGLRGEVEIQVRNKETGKIESQQKHNLVVYGGREWLLKKAFNTNVSNNPDYIRNSEILWFGIGNGGGEPGNPLQCGCTYGSDDDLYNPVRMRYDFNSNVQSTNPYYASRILPNGEVVNGYYKKITYVSIKEDQANPYKLNNVIHYPNLIAELRLEISPDDCCGQTFLDNDYERSYADINEAALFISDSRYTDPGMQEDSLTYFTQDYTSYNANRTDLPEFERLPEKTVTYKDGNAIEYNWSDENIFPKSCIQYFNLYDNTNNAKLNTQPILMGIYKDGSDTSGYIKLDSDKNIVSYHFENDGDEINGTIENIPEHITSLDNINFLSNGTIHIKAIRSSKIESDKDPKVRCLYRYNFSNKTNSSNTSDFIAITNYENVFTECNEYHYFIPAGYILNGNEWVPSESFKLNSLIRIVQTTNFADDCIIKEIITDPNTLQCKCFVDNSIIKNFKEGQVIYTYNDSNSKNKIPEDDPATITDIYDARDEYGSDTLERSYFIIERQGFVDEVYDDKTLFPKGGLQCKYYKLQKDKPYIMFNRVTFSTIRISMSRDIILIWRIYF